MKDSYRSKDFYVTVGDGKGNEQTVLIWVPLAITAYNVVVENGKSRKVAEKASAAVIHHGEGINYNLGPTVRRQVIMSARKAADAVIEELGNGDVAAAVLEAVRVGGEILVSAKASGIVINALAVSDPDEESTVSENESTSSNIVKVTLMKPMGIVFEPVGDPQECRVRIRELPRGGKAHQSKELKVGDELMSINDNDMSNLTFFEILEFIAEEDEQKEFDLILERPNRRKMKAAMSRRFRNLVRRRSISNKSLPIDQRDDEAPSYQSIEIPSPKKASSFFRFWPSSSSRTSDDEVQDTQQSKLCSTDVSGAHSDYSESGAFCSVLKLLDCVDLYGEGHSLTASTDCSDSVGDDEQRVPF